MESRRRARTPARHSAMRRRSILLAALALWASAVPAARARAAPYSARPDVQEFVGMLADEQGLPRQWIETIIDSGRHSPAAERLMTPGLTPPPRDWRRYRAQALDTVRLREAAQFRQTQRPALARAAEEFGVAPEVIVSIIGIETLFGRLMGRFRTLDVLVTLAFDYPRRAAFYRSELAHFLVLGYDGRIDVRRQTGSFAGAIGLPQFMPGSIRRFALDYDGDGRIDLTRSAADAIGSIGSYLRHHGWQPDKRPMFDATAEPEVAEQLGRGIVADRSWADLAALGVRIDGYLPPETPVLLVDLPYRRDDGGSGVEYRVGTVNLSALLHYNRSYFYAAAVAEFAATLHDERGT